MNNVKKHGGCASSEGADGEKEEVSAEQGRNHSQHSYCSILVFDIKSTDSFRSAFLLITAKMDNAKV